MARRASLHCRECSDRGMHVQRCRTALFVHCCHIILIRNLAIYGYQIPQHPDQLTTPTVDDSIRSLQLNVSCIENVIGGTCADLIA